MHKKYYEKELSISGTQKKNSSKNNKKDVSKIQSWLTLYSMVNPTAGSATAVDGDYGPGTERAVLNFQQAANLPQSGVVTQDTFAALCEPMRNAFEKDLTARDFRQTVLDVAHNHVANTPFELVVKTQSNSGPWVRAYMDGNEGSPWYWCMGFVQTIIDQAASLFDKSFKTLMPLTYSCDTVGTIGLQKGLLTRYSKIRSNPSIAKPGDIFLLQRVPYDWTHTGIITAVGADTFETIEGNTNGGGSSNGNAALKRVRNFRQSKLDVFSIDPLTE